jgi:hypothetical protein
MTFHYSTLASDENVPARNASELLDVAQRCAVWDDVIIEADADEGSRATVSWHAGRGFVVHCFEDAVSLGFFLAESLSFSAPAVDIVLGGQVQERWPRELFVSPDLAREALDFFLEAGSRSRPCTGYGQDAYLARRCGRDGRDEKRGGIGSGRIYSNDCVSEPRIGERG